MGDVQIPNKDLRNTPITEDDGKTLQQLSALNLLPETAVKDVGHP